jgi:type VI secretion system secreted protein Hcp
MAIYVEYQDIKGKITSEGFKDHIAFDSFNFGVGRPISMEPGNMANREKTKPSISEISLTRATDGASLPLFKEAVSGTVGKTVKVKLVHTGGDKDEEYMSFELSETLVSGFNISAGGDGEPMESITLSFSKIQVSYTDTDSSGKTGTPTRGGYDLKASKKV